MFTSLSLFAVALVDVLALFPRPCRVSTRVALAALVGYALLFALARQL